MEVELTSGPLGSHLVDLTRRYFWQQWDGSLQLGRERRLGRLHFLT
jgi:hypothetical protein